MQSRSRHMCKCSENIPEHSAQVPGLISETGNLPILDPFPTVPSMGC